MFSEQDIHLYKENPLKHHTEDWHLKEAEYRKAWNDYHEQIFHTCMQSDTHNSHVLLSEGSELHSCTTFTSWCYKKY